MLTVRDFLERLRPSGTPGAATLSGVPADRVGERSVELGPVLAQLDDVQAEASRIRHAAGVEAQHRKDVAVEQARAIVAVARHAAEAERGEAEAKARSQAVTESRGSLAEAVREAAAVAEAARARESGLVDRVVSLARAELSAIRVNTS